MIEGTALAWLDALTFNRVWDEQRDAPRIRQAFRALGATCREWPSPVDLVTHLPKVEELLALPSKPVSHVTAQENIERIKRMLKGEE